MKIDPETYDWAREAEIYTKEEAVNYAKEATRFKRFKDTLALNIIIIPDPLNQQFKVYYDQRFCGTFSLI